MLAKHFHLLFHDAGTRGAVQGQLWKCFLRSKGNCETRLLWDKGKSLSWTRRRGRPVGPGELADVEAKPELGQLPCGISIPEEEEAWVQFWSEIWSSPSLGISGILLQGNVLALGCCRNREAPELPRGPCSAKVYLITCAGTELSPSPWALFPWQKLPPGLHLSEVCASTLV